MGYSGIGQLKRECFRMPELDLPLLQLSIPTSFFAFCGDSASHRFTTLAASAKDNHRLVRHHCSAAAS